MRFVFVLLVFLMAFTGAHAQDYRVYTEKTDPFSRALVDILQCAKERFKSCTGDSIRTTWLMGTDYYLGFTFPGSSIAIIRNRDFDINAYVEFRGYPDRESREKGVREIVARIRNTFGERLYDRTSDTAKNVYFYGLSLRDDNGYYGMNMEIFGSSSSSPIYLLGPERESDDGVKEHFILLKIYPGIPMYSHFIREIKAPDQDLHNTIQQLLKHAETDFISLKVNGPLHGKNRKRDTIRLNGVPVFMDYSGTYSATLKFPLSADTSDFQKQWAYYQQVLQAALGTGYNYHMYTLGEKNFITYFGSSSAYPHRIGMEMVRGTAGNFILIDIPSLVPKPRKAGLDADDFDWKDD